MTPEDDYAVIESHHEGVTLAIRYLAAALGVEDWQISDGSEDAIEDVKDTICGVLVKAGIGDTEDNVKVLREALARLTDAAFQYDAWSNEARPTHVIREMLDAAHDAREALSATEPGKE